MKKSQQHEWRSHGKKTKNEKRSIDRSIGTPPPPATPDGPSELESDLSSLFSSGTRKDPESRRDSAGSLTLELTPSSGKIGMIISPRVSNLPPRTISKVHQKRLEALNNPRSKEEEEEKQGKERKQGEEKKKEEMKKYDEAMAKMAANREKFVKKKNEEKTEKKENAAIPTRAAESTPSQQRVKKLSKRKAKGQSVNGAAPAVGEEESDEEESANWTSMRPFVPLQKNGMGEKSDKKQLKSDRKREKREAEERERRNSVTTVLSYPPATVSQEKTKEKEGSQVAKPDIVPTVSSQPPSTVSSPPSSTTAVGSEKNEKYSKHGAVKNFVDTVPSQSSTSVSREPSSRLATVSREPSYRPATVFKTGRPATVFQTGRPATVRHADNHLKYGKNGVAKPVHTVFYDSSPEKKAANNDAVKSPVKPIDRSTEESSPRRSRRLSESSSLQQTAAASATPPPAATPSRHNGRVTRDSSPEVSSTSSESSDDERAEERRRSKKVVVRPEVTSSISKRDTAVTASPAKNDPPSKTATPLKEKRAKEEEEKGGEEVVKEEKKEKSKKKKKKKKDKNTVRPSTDLLRMVAERLANGHGLMVFRLISSETRRIAEEQLRRVDDVLHLEEFDDENAFTRDDMTEWWEQRREVEDETVSEGKETLSHTQISAYLNMRKVEKRLLTDMDGGLSNPRNADSSVQPSQLLQHPLAAIDASCLLHESQTLAATRLLQHGCKRLQEVWLGHCKSKLVREVPRLAAIERFEHRQATMETLDKLPLLQMTELRLDIVDESVTAEGLADHLVNCQQLRALELNVAPTGIVDGNTSTHYALFTRRCYDRENYTDDLEWMVPNVEEGEPDPITLCTPSLEHLATNVANVKLLWQLRDSTLLLRHLRVRASRV